MAIAAGDQVALHRAAGVTLGALGNVLFGICIDASSGRDIVWENGNVSDAVPEASLDKIASDGDSQPQKLVTFTDAPSGVNSPEYRCVVVRRYSRDPAGGGTPVDYVLMKSLASGQLYESPAAAVVALDGV